MPAWYGPDGTIFVAMDEAEAAGQAVSHYGEPVALTRDEDVLDTWFSSALWPFSTLGWPERTPELERFYPTSVLVTGFDIIFFWVARMMMMGLRFMGDVPFYDVCIHGLVRDERGQKMSKSKGNVIDPLELIDKYGADALRLTILASTAQGQDIRFAEGRVQGYRNFATKLWNAARFCELQGCELDPGFDPHACRQIVNRWAVGKLAQTAARTRASLEDYRFNEAASALYHFTWDEFCDWYLELAKVQIAEGGERAEATRSVLGHVLDVVLRLLHPLTPFITETLWKTLTGGESLVISEWPKPSGAERDETAAARVEGLKKLVTEIRRFRSDQGLRPTQKVAGKVRGACCVDLVDQVPSVKALTRMTEPGDDFAVSASLEVGLPKGTVTVELDTSGTIDVVAERKRMTKDLAVAEKERAQCEGKLNNPAFTDKAPADVVAKIQARLAAANADIERLNARIAALPEAK
ncbi:class I tRNA ligase family protein [Umezawaea sp.]|uniref:class I tRNA ligase family protein n=1 Tax=Umezawaea sp. TaxID=1955258 RepID=UPI0039C927C6